MQWANVLTPLAIAGMVACGSSDDPTNPEVDPPGGDPPPTFSFTVEALPAQGGTTDPAPGGLQADSGSTVLIQATAADGWGFREWRGDASGSVSEISRVLSAPGLTFTAYFDCGPAVAGGACFSPPHGPTPGPDFGWTGFRGEGEHIQTFVPLVGQLTAVAVELWHGAPQIAPGPIRLSIWDSDALGEPLARGAVEVPDDYAGGWLTIPLDGGGLVVDPRTEIVLAAWSDDGAFGWMYWAVDVYPDGRGRTKDEDGDWNENSIREFFFRVNPE